MQTVVQTGSGKTIAGFSAGKQLIDWLNTWFETYIAAEHVCAPPDVGVWRTIGAQEFEQSGGTCYECRECGQLWSLKGESDRSFLDETPRIPS